MAYPRHALLTFGGRMMTETWSVGFRFWGDGWDDLTSAQRYDACQSRIDSFVGPIQSFFSGNTAINGDAKCFWIKYNSINPDGTYEHARTVSRESGSTPYATGGGQLCPPQTAIAVSLRTPVDRGLGAKGRIYWPNGIYQVDQQGQITLAQATSLANYTGSLLLALGSPTAGQAGGDELMAASIVSGGRGGPKSTEPGVARHITSVAVGRVIDTQQRRRRSLVEGHVRRTLAEIQG